MPTRRLIRLSASPLLVAVALGMLGPAVLEEEEETPSAHRPDADGDRDLDTMDVSGLMENLREG